MTVKISEQRTKEGYEITFFTDNKLLLRKARMLLDELSSKEMEIITAMYCFNEIKEQNK